MEQSIHVETGAQLLARLMKRPVLHGLEKDLFSDGPRPNEVIEVSGNLSSGKTLLITQLIAKCLLPRRYKGIELNGREAGVVLVNTDHHFHIPTLVDLMACFIRNNKDARKLGTTDVFDDKGIKSIIENSLRYFTVINCYESSQFFLGLQSLQGILSNDDKIAMIAIDSISSYYWQDRKHGQCWSMDGYVKSCLNIMQKHTSGHKIILLYTRPSDVESKGKEAAVRTSLPNEEKVHYKIQLHKQHDVNQFSAVVESVNDNRNLSYIVSNNGIEWRTCYSKR